MIIILNRNNDENILQCIPIAQAFKESGFIIVQDPQITSSHIVDVLYEIELCFGRSNAASEFGVGGVTPEIGALPTSTAHFWKVFQQLGDGVLPERPVLPESEDPKVYLWKSDQQEGIGKGSFFWKPGCISEVLMKQWEEELLSTVEVISDLLATGLGLSIGSFKKIMVGSHRLISSGVNLEGEEEGKILEVGHHDLNMFTILAGHKYMAMNVWTKEDEDGDKKVEVHIPAGHLMILAGKQLEHLTGGKIISPKHEIVVSKKTVEEMNKATTAKGRKISLWRIVSSLYTSAGDQVELFPLGPYNNREAMIKYPNKPAAQFLGMVAPLPLEEEEVKEKKEKTD